MTTYSYAVKSCKIVCICMYRTVRRYWLYNLNLCSYMEGKKFHHNFSSIELSNQVNLCNKEWREVILIKLVIWSMWGYLYITHTHTHTHTHMRQFLTKFDWVNVALLHCWCSWGDDNIVFSCIIIRNQNDGWVWIFHVLYLTPWDAGSRYTDHKISWRWCVTNLQ